jgi:hypothetical protein
MILHHKHLRTEVRKGFGRGQGDIAMRHFSVARVPSAAIPATGARVVDWSAFGPEFNPLRCSSDEIHADLERTPARLADRI